MRFDIAIVGPGVAGLCAALALARDGFRVALVGDPDARADGRTVALLDGSVRLLEALGVWPSILPDAAPLRVMRIIDDTGSLFRPPPATFDAAEIALDAFGWNIENAVLVERLAAAVRADDRIAAVEAKAEALTIEANDAVLALAGRESLRASLVVAAEGRRSRLRESARIPVRTWSYPQTALAAILTHAREHGDASTEFHTRRGPFTLVPLPGRRSSLVWVTSPAKAQELAALDDAGFALAAERQAHSLVGAMAVAGPRGAVPMSGLSVERTVAPRLAVVGEAAHVFPPIGAQGLNLGLRDVAALRDAVLDGRGQGSEPGSEAILAAYERGRRLDIGLRTAAVDGLNRSLLADILPVDFLRGAGLLALSGIGPLRRAVMREGVLPRLDAPRLMRRAA